MNGLTKTYAEANILDQREEFARFVRGFNMAHPLCDFIDAGNGKECSDVKIRGESKTSRGINRWDVLVQCSSSPQKLPNYMWGTFIANTSYLEALPTMAVRSF